MQNTNIKIYSANVPQLRAVSENATSHEKRMQEGINLLNLNLDKNRSATFLFDQSRRRQSKVFQALENDLENVVQFYELDEETSRRFPSLSSDKALLASLKRSEQKIARIKKLVAGTKRKLQSSRSEKGKESCYAKLSNEILQMNFIHQKQV